VDILITKDNFWIVMDIVIADSICTNMVQQTSMMTTHVVMMVVHEKTRSYTEQAPSNDFIPLAIETYGCFHFHFYSYLIVCAHTIMAHH